MEEESFQSRFGGGRGIRVTEGGGKSVPEEWCLVGENAVTRRFQAVRVNAKQTGLFIYLFIY